MPVQTMPTPPSGPTTFRPLRIPALHDCCTVAWHTGPTSIPEELNELGHLSDLERTVATQHLANFELWHAEDEARTPGATDQAIARVKHLIDQVNQRRNDLSEQCDLMLLHILSQQSLPDAKAEVHSESPGLILDRLSILALKIFHTREEMERPEAPDGHRERNRERLHILTAQRDDLAHALDRLWQQVLQRKRQFKLYRQLKMYNDPTLNPAVYSARLKP